MFNWQSVVFSNWFDPIWPLSFLFLWLDNSWCRAADRGSAAGTRSNFTVTSQFNLQPPTTSSWLKQKKKHQNSQFINKTKHLTNQPKCRCSWRTVLVIRLGRKPQILTITCHRSVSIDYFFIYGRFAVQNFLLPINKRRVPPKTSREIQTTEKNNNNKNKGESKVEIINTIIYWEAKNNNNKEKPRSTRTRDKSAKETRVAGQTTLADG